LTISLNPRWVLTATNFLFLIYFTDFLSFPRHFYRTNLLNFCINIFIPQDAIAKGEEPPARPKPFFSADPTLRSAVEDSAGNLPEEAVEVSGKNLKERTKPTGKGGKSFGKK
jgi:hypothetical protein